MGALSTFLTLASIVVTVTSGKEFCPDNCRCDLVSKVVDCRNAGLTRIPWELPDPTNLRQIDLSGNDIHEVLLETVSYTNLELLDLSHNRLVNIEDGVMANLPHLKSLYLHNNDMSELSKDTLSGLKALKVLDLSQNQLKVIKDDVFADLVSLEELNLAGNGVTQIREDSFAGLTNLRTLNFGDNRLRNIPVEALKKTTQLTKLFINENELESVPMHSFRLLEDLRELHLQDNRISEISENAFFDHEKSDTPALQILNLGGNHLEKIPSSALTRLNSLVNIDLSKNPMKVVDPDSFKGLDRIRRISLNSLPELKVVRKYAFSELENIQVIEMHSNRALGDIEEGAFLATPALTKVDLHANQLQTMSAALLDWDTLAEVDLRYNPWECDCHLNWLPEKLTSLHRNNTQHLVTNVRCETPEGLAGRDIHGMSAGQLVCPEEEKEFEEHILIAIIASFSVVLFVVMMYLLCKHGYCSLTGKKVQRPANYHVHRHCNGNGPPHRGVSEEHVHIAENEHLPADNVLA